MKKERGVCGLKEGRGIERGRSLGGGDEGWTGGEPRGREEEDEGIMQ